MFKYGKVEMGKRFLKDLVSSLFLVIHKSIIRMFAFDVEECRSHLCSMYTSTSTKYGQSFPRMIDENCQDFQIGGFI